MVFDNYDFESRRRHRRLPLLLEVAPKLVEDAPLPLATGSKVKMFDLDEDNNAKLGGMLHNKVISGDYISLTFTETYKDNYPYVFPSMKTTIDNAKDHYVI